MDKKLTLQCVKDAQKRLEGTVHKTSLENSKTFSKLCNCDIFLKTENMQKTGSFKVRGAYNKVSMLVNSKSINTVVTASAGNHAQGVAYGANENGIEAIIVMPKSTPIAKVSATQNYGAKTVLHGDCYDDAYTKALEIAKESNGEFLHPFNDIDVIAGQGTVAIEMLEQNPDLDYIIVPAGGGGLLAGVAFTAKQIKPSIKVIGVQGEKADSIVKSFKKKKLVIQDTIFTIADGIAVKTPGDITLEYIFKYADDIMTVSDDDIASTIIQLIERTKLVVEPAGATPLACVLANKSLFKGKKVGLVLSGGNIDVGFIHKIIERGLVSRGRQMRLSVVLTDKPGALADFATIMSDNSANIISMQYDRTSTDLNINQTILHISCEVGGFEQGKSLVNNLGKAGYTIIKSK